MHLRFAPFRHTRHSCMAHLVIVHSACKDTGIWSHTVIVQQSDSPLDRSFRHLLQPILTPRLFWRDRAAGNAIAYFAQEVRP